MTALARVVGLPGAVLLGLGSIVGSGLFLSIALAATIAGPQVALAVVIAAAVAADAHFAATNSQPAVKPSVGDR